jgi:hypothetical protein
MLPSLAKACHLDTTGCDGESGFHSILGRRELHEWVKALGITVDGVVWII